MAVSASDAVFDAVRSEGGVVVTATPGLDLDSYIQNYSGRTRFSRLLFIGTHSTVLCVDALKAAVVEARKGRDIERYNVALAALRSVDDGAPEAQPDSAWVMTTKKHNAKDSERLEAELKAYKNNLVKESIRMGNEDLGKHYHSIGELAKSYEAFGRMRQDVTVPAQVLDIARHQIDLSLEQKNWMAVSSNVQKALGIPQTSEEQADIAPFLSIAAGVAYLAAGKFRQAATEFLATSPGMGSTFNHAFSPNDVAIYGGLSALATMDRDELQKKVLENSSFRTYLELEPHVRRAIQFFVNGRYSACLSTLETYRIDYQVDIYLANQVNAIYHQIRGKSIVQYFIPFSCVTFDSLREAFGRPGEDIEEELMRMIESGELVARIDMQNGLLISVPENPRATLQSSTLASAKAYEREMRLRVQRMNILGAGLEVKGKAKGGQQGLTMNNSFGGGDMGGRSLRSGA